MKTVADLKSFPRSFVPVTAVWLRAEGKHAVVLVELEGKWIEVCREFMEGPFSHIVEGRGIDSRAEKQGIAR